MSAPTLTQTIEQLRTALIEYLESAYHIRDEGLLQQRRALLGEWGVVAQVPFVEVLPQYQTEGDLFATGADAPLPEGARQALKILTKKRTGRHGVTLERRVFNPPYKHQLEAVRHAMGTHPTHRDKDEAARRRSLVVTTGTGSGKTECFLMPMVAQLAQQAYEGRAEGTEAAQKRWDQRGVRALVLYPMNALVNDQLGRLRGWLGDEDLVSLFLDEWGTRRPIRFGRYTGRATFPGLREHPRRDALGRVLRGANGKIRWNKVSRQKQAFAPKVAKGRTSRVKTFKTFYLELQRKVFLAEEEVKGGTPESDLSADLKDALRLYRELHRLGKWPAKPDLGKYFLNDTYENWWQNDELPSPRWMKNDNTPNRLVTQDRDTEHYSRHETHDASPDVLVTNYSMLEYMLMRPLERGIFEETARYYRDHPSEKLLLVVDEGHLYRGTTGAEVALLLRRLQQRLGLGPDRVQVILTSASFSTPEAASEFAAALTGKEAEHFEPLQGAMKPSAGDAPITAAELEALAGVQLARFEEERRSYLQVGPDGSTMPKEELADYRRRRVEAVRPLLEYASPALKVDAVWEQESARIQSTDGALEQLLYEQLEKLGLLQRLRFVAMPRQGSRSECSALDFDGESTGPRPVGQPVPQDFPGKPLIELAVPSEPGGDTLDAETREQALTALLSLATSARDASGNALLPARVHALFRGLPGLWLCTSRSCSELPEAQRGGIAGKLYAHDPGLSCGCGARVLPLYTCRDCGAAFLRGYTTAARAQLKTHGAVAAVTGGAFLWAEPGEPVEVGGKRAEELEPLDLLLPASAHELLTPDQAQALELDPQTGRLLLPAKSVSGRVLKNDRTRTFVFGSLPHQAAAAAADNNQPERLSPGQHKACPCCLARGARGSTVMDHQTKGSQPLAAIIAAQLRAQRARDPEDTGKERERRLRFAPLQGRKTLVFSDSRQKAAKLSMFLNSYAARDAARSLLLRGWKWLLKHRPEKRLSLHHVRHALLIGEAITGRPLRVPCSEAAREHALDAARGRVHALVGAGEALDIDDLIEELGSSEPLPETWAALPYAAATGTWLKVDADGGARPGKSRVSALNRSSTLTSLALGQLRPASAQRAAARAAVRAAVVGSKHAGDAQQDAHCDALLSRWLFVVASAHGVHCKGMIYDDWLPQNGQGAIRVVGGLAGGGRNRLRERLLKALHPIAKQPLTTLHNTLREMLCNDNGFLSSKKLTLWIPELVNPVYEDAGPEPVAAWSLCATCGTVAPHVHCLRIDDKGTTRCAQCGKCTAEPLPLKLELGSRTPVAVDDPYLQSRIEWFQRRKGHLRQPAVDLLLADVKPIVPVAAEHTAAVGDAPRGEAFSPAEFHELLFQDVEAGPDHLGRKRPAVDVLSATTTMEVGIDIGSLSGVALRNMPPRRDNYQQRSGRAGRRGDGVASVIAWANTGGHDIHAFERPQVVLTDPIDDPRLALGNERVATRHAAAVLVQAYVHTVLKDADPLDSPQLFEVLGSVDSFFDPTSPVNLEGLDRFAAELAADPAASERLFGLATSGMTAEARKRFLGQDGGKPLASRLAARIREVVLAEHRRRGGGEVTGYRLATHLFRSTGGRVRPVLDFFSRKTESSAPETDWLELKAVVVPDKNSPHRVEGSRDSDYRWHVAKAIIALRNTSGGVVIVGVSDKDGTHVENPGLEESSDAWWRALKRPLLGPSESWSEWSPSRARKKLRLTDDSSLQGGAVTLSLGELDGKLVALVFVKPASDPVELVRVQEEGSGTERVYSRLLGEAGQDQKHCREADRAAVERAVGDIPPHLTTHLREFDRWWKKAGKEYPDGTLVAGQTATGDEAAPAGGASEPEEKGRSDAREQQSNKTFQGTEGEGEATHGADSEHTEASSDWTSVHDREAGPKRSSGRLRSERDSLLRLLIDEGVLPSYAFPTEVTALHILDKTDTDTSAERQRALYTVSQGLEQALSQYAPGREVYVDNRRWHVGAIFDRSYRQKERRAAYAAARFYLYCSACGTYSEQADGKQLTKDDMQKVASADGEQVYKKKACSTCGVEVPVRLWFRPTGFLHVPPTKGGGVLQPLAYPTPARLVAPSPDPDDPAVIKPELSEFGARLDVTSGWRAELVHLNLGARDSGFAYCDTCGRIESVHAVPKAEFRTSQPHPYPHNAPLGEGRVPQQCDGRVATNGRTLGHSLKTDVSLFRMQVGQAGLSLDPKSPEATAAVESLTQALLIAGSERVLRLGRGELGAGHRWPEGGDAVDTVIDIYLYDRVPGGAGYSDELGAPSEAASATPSGSSGEATVSSAARSLKPSARRLLATADEVLTCSAGCSSSCYSCLRRYENQRDHARLDRNLALYVLQSLRHGAPPDDWLPDGGLVRLRLAAQALAAQLRARGDGWVVEVEKVEKVEGLVKVSWTHGERGAGELLLALERPLPSDGMDDLARVGGKKAREWLQELDTNDLDPVTFAHVSAYRVGHDLPQLVQDLVRIACP